MNSNLKELIKEAKTKKDALENIHIELQNLKIQLVNKGYKVITTPGEPGPHFEEDLDPSQNFNNEDQALVEYYRTIKALKDAAEKAVREKKTNFSSDPYSADIITILMEKPDVTE